ncbi:MAG: phospholipase D-like domain-containing protein [Candidatus Poribacteria bacterium]|nr:phospholipase D-like domain-containing protein [Candidatus Poribacteria bacterium]
MMQTILSPWADAFEVFARSVRKSAILVSQFITAPPLQRFASLLDADNQPQVTLLTNLEVDSLLQETVDVNAIAQFCREVPTTSVRNLPGLHAKVYVADESVAIVTSGNLTNNSLNRNYEYGIQIDNSTIVRRIACELQDYGRLGASVSLEELDYLAESAATLRAKHSARLNSSRSELKHEFQNQLDSVRGSLLQLREKPGESKNAIFERTLMYLLKNGPLTTQELHPLIQNIHPDLCDDQMDLVISGVNFGKKWKHSVRNAQQGLKSKGLIERVGKQWQLV